MNLQSIKTVMRKELRSYFLSPVALIFLGIFLTVTLFVFFTYAKFFARNLADIRPLFTWLPVLLIFLVSALTMRQWSEEQKMGTLEILMTMPVRTADLVLGKFAAGMTLVAVALLLTTPLAFTAGWLGPLDWGPVIGGYLAALLLASAYMAVGLCVSARTDNQIVALMVSTLVCGALYLVGSDAVTGLLGHGPAEILRSLGTGSRFSSIERGVLDIRDLVYYGSLTAFFLLLNVQFIELNRTEADPGAGRASRRALALSVLLAGLNAVAANLWLSPVRTLRADLTAEGEYSVSPATAKIIAGLDEPLTITGYFSEKTHPLLAPLVPRIQNLLEEYEVIGGDKVRARFIDPNKDEELEQEINESYGIKSVPFRVASRHEKSVVNSYFHLLVSYGDEYQVLGFDDLIEVYADSTEVQVRLKNLEYDLTRAIKKATQGFQSIEAILARMNTKATLTAYISKDNLPEEFKEAPARLEKVATELAEAAGGRFQYKVVDPTGDPAMQQEIFQKYGFRPMAVSLFGEERFYLYLLYQAGDRAESIFPQGDLSEANLKTTIEAAVKRSTPGFLKTVALLTEKPQQPQYGGFPGMPPPQADYRALEQALGEELSFKRVDLENGVVPGDVDVLVVAKPGKLSDKQLFAVDQYLMRGGAVVALAGAFDISREIKATRADGSFLALLKSYGVEVEEKMVMDPVNARFPIPVQEKRGPFVFERVQMLSYPFFPDIRKDGFAEGHVALSGVPSVAATWASPVRVEPGREGLKSQVLLYTSPDSWLKDTTDLQPNFKQFPDTGFLSGSGEDTARRPVGVTVVGRFQSHFKDRPSPLFTEPEESEDVDDDEEAAEGEGEEPTPPTIPETEPEEKGDPDHTGRTLKASTPDARLVVIGSSSFASDMIVGLDFRSGTDSFGGNMMLLRNLVDWALEDTDLLEIRTAGNFARTLRPLSTDDRKMWEAGNYIVVLLALFAVGVVSRTRRNMARPIDLV